MCKVIRPGFTDNRVPGLNEKIRDAIEEYSKTADVSYALVIGVLEVLKHEFLHEASQEE